MTAPTAAGTSRLGAGRYIDAAEQPANTTTSVHELTTADGAKVAGVLRTDPCATVVVAHMVWDDDMIDDPSPVIATVGHDRHLDPIGLAIDTCRQQNAA